MLKQTAPTAEDIAKLFGDTINTLCDMYSTDAPGDWPGSKAREDKRKLRLKIAHLLIASADEPLADFLTSYFKADAECDGNSDEDDRSVLIYNFYHSAPRDLAFHMCVTHNCEAPV